MITISSDSKFTGLLFKNAFDDADCLESWMRSSFHWKGHSLTIHQIEQPDRRSIGVPWWKTWYMAALAAWQSDKWEITTGEIKYLDGGKTETIGDGVRMGEDSGGKWKETFDRPEKGNVLGVTLPNQQEKDAILKATKKRPELWTAGITTARTASGRGAIVIVTRVDLPGSYAGPPTPRSSNQIVGTFFHEMFHAGRMAQRKEFSDNREYFDNFVENMERYFGNPNDSLLPLGKR